MKHISDRLYNKKWGVFNHFLYGVPGGTTCVPEYAGNWNERVNALNVEKIAKNLHEMGAGYYFITVMQGRKYMIAPNQTFDEIAGVSAGEACAKRDLIEDLYQVLSKYNIDLYLYYTGDGPYKDEEIGEKFGFLEPRKNVSMDFVQKWAAVQKEYSVRYGEKVCGWWIDGCYEYFGYTNELLTPYHDAIKAGNPNAVSAFNNGVKEKIEKWYENEEFTCGEFNDFKFIPKERFVNGAQAHILAPLGVSPDKNQGGGWGMTGVKYNSDYMREYISKVNHNGGVVTVDIAIMPDGSFDQEQMKVLKAMRI